jgi:Skp family chaperone for outer membrane proteins
MSENAKPERSEKMRMGWTGKVQILLMLMSVVILGSVRDVAAQQDDNKGETTDQKVGFVDYDLIEDQWLEYRVFSSYRQKQHQIDMADVSMMQEDLIKRRQTLEENQNKGLIAEDEFQRRRQQLIMEAQEIAVYARVRSRLISEKLQKKQMHARKVLQDAVKEVGDEEKFDFILSESRLLGVDRQLDVSGKVIEVLNSNTYDIIYQ